MQKQQKEPTIQKAYTDCFLLLTRHYYDSGDAGNRAALVETYKDLLTKFLSNRVMAGSGLNIGFVQQAFTQCPALAWELQGQVLKCFLAGEDKTTARSNHQRL